MGPFSGSNLTREFLECIIPAVLLGKICMLIIVERHCSKIVLSNVELYIGIVWMIRLNYHPLSLVLLEN